MCTNNTLRIGSRVLYDLSTVRRLLILGALISTAAMAEDARAVLTNLPGFDFTKLPAAAQSQLAQVFTDEFDYCGRPLTLAASLKKGDACKHTKRMAAYAAVLAADGSPSTEIVNALSKYNQSFTAKRADLKPDVRMCQGNPLARVTVTEFSDFECPYCAMARPILEEMVRKNANMRLCYAPFPLSGHPHGLPAAQTALFARDYGKFWQMHDLLFDNQTAFSDQMFANLAKKLGLDEKLLAKALGSGKYKDELDASREMGKAAGVDSTPSIYFNGRKLTLIPSVESLAVSYDDELDWSEHNSWPSN